jgi:hypothetical protein
MAVVFIQEFQVSDRSTENYDWISEKLNLQEPPEGLIVHTAGFDDGVFRIVDVWEDQGSGERFMREQLEPLIAELTSTRPGAPPPSRESWYELHDVIAR